MKRVWISLKQHPFHLILFPVFFILETWFRYKGLLNIRDTVLSFFIVQIIIIVAFVIFNLILKNKLKAGIIVTAFSFLYLYFGSIKVSLGNIQYISIMSHYKVFVPILLALFTFFVFKIVKRKNVTGLNLFINILFATYLLLELIKTTFPDKENIKIATIETASFGNSPAVEASPNIYYLLFDCYPSAVYQQQVLGITNNFLDSLLKLKKFYVVKNSTSNYSNTAFSLASTFGMNYIEGIDTAEQMSPLLYNKAMNMVKKAPLFPLLKKAGYNFANLSIFDFADKPALQKEKFLSITTNQIIFYFSFYDCIRRDLFWQLLPTLHKKSIQKEKGYLKKLLGPHKAHNRQLIDTLSGSAFFSRTKRPFFLYAHFEMPHFPYFYDAKGNPYPDDSIYTSSLINDREKFAGYIEYTNQQIKKIVENILLQTKGNDIIIVQSDHGIIDIDPTRKDDAFRNVSAFYFPDNEYSLLYEGMSNVNSFRVLLNKYFQQQLPLLKDNSFFTR